jgi:hypothetical protein
MTSTTAATAAQPTTVKHRRIFAASAALAGLSIASLAPSQAGARVGVPAAGFTQPFAGTPKYERYAPAEVNNARQVNRPLGRKAADRIARELGLDKRQVFTAKQYRLFASGRGIGGKQAPAKLARQSIRILTNTTGTPDYVRINGKLTPVVLGSYGLTVNRAGMLESPANSDAATRQINTVITPGGYFPTWCRHNGAQASLRMLYRSAYTSEVVYGFRAQQQSGAAQLAPNQKGLASSIVGMSMAPPLWIVNLVLMYTLNPQMAAKMPARWAPIPANVALAIAASPTGQVSFSKYKSSFPG